MFKSVKIPTLELMEGDIPNAYTHCMCACALIYPWTKTSVKNQHWTARLAGHWAVSSAALAMGHGCDLTFGKTPILGH